jgi:membrane-associated phospholipid phosphatase
MRVEPARTNNVRLVSAAILFASVMVLWAYLRYVGPLPGDEAILREVAVRPGLRSSHLLQFLGDLGTTSVALLTVLFAAALVGRALGVLAAAVVLLASAGVLLNEVVRTVLGPTPSSEATFGAFVESYPSGHAVYATTVFGILASLAWTHGRRDAAAVLIWLIAAMGPARVLASAHLASDVVGGYLLGGAWLLITLAIYDRTRARRDRQPGA